MINIYYLVCQAKYPFQAQQPGDLSFSKGQKILAYPNKLMDNGWCRGCVKENHGWFPWEYVDVLHLDRSDDSTSLWTTNLDESIRLMKESRKFSEVRNKWTEVMRDLNETIEKPSLKMLSSKTSLLNKPCRALRKSSFSRYEIFLSLLL